MTNAEKEVYMKGLLVKLTEELKQSIAEVESADNLHEVADIYHRTGDIAKKYALEFDKLDQPEVKL